MRDWIQAFMGLQVDLNRSCPSSLPCLSSKAGPNQCLRDCVTAALGSRHPCLGNGSLGAGL